MERLGADYRGFKGVVKAYGVWGFFVGRTIGDSGVLQEVMGAEGGLWGGL